MKYGEEFINRTENYHIYSHVEDFRYTYFGDEPTIGEIFRGMSKEYGRCSGKVYIDTADGVRAIGWVFEKRVRYEDSKDTYLQEVWITLYDHHEDEIVRHREYHYIGGAS
jgi:hypothetical protein